MLLLNVLIPRQVQSGACLAGLQYPGRVTAQSVHEVGPILRGERPAAGKGVPRKTSG